MVESLQYKMPLTVPTEDVMPQYIQTNTKCTHSYCIKKGKYT